MTLPNALDGAKIIGFKSTDFGETLACVWYGGGGFNVYDTEEWEENYHWNNTQLLAGNVENETEKVIDEMKERGYDPVVPSE